MQNPWLFLRMGILLAAVATGVAKDAPVHVGPAQSRIVIGTVPAVVRSGSKIEVTVKETFVKSGVDGMTVGEPIQYAVEVRAVNGKMAPETRLGKELNGGPIKVTTNALFDVKAGVTWKNKVFPSELYDMSQPGGYSIQVSRRSVKSNKVTVTVVP
jgi:hypothetical protein